MKGKLPLTLPILKTFRRYDLDSGNWYGKDGETRVGYKHRSNATREYIVVDLGQYGREYAHRLAYFWVHGEWPPNLMDHRDNNGLNNAWDNLRPATYSQNGFNTKVNSRNKSGVTGVTWDQVRGKWRYDLRHDGKRVYGHFHTREEAVAARLDAERLYFVW